MEPTEHLVIRDPQLNNQSLEVVKVWNLRNCKILSQSKIGGLPSGFTADKHGQPRNVHVGDLVWFAQKRYAVIGTLRIKAVYPIREVKSLEDIETLRKDSLYSSLEATYWDSLRDDLPKLKGRVIKFASVETEFGQQFSEADQFLLNSPPNFQQSWVVLDSPENKELLRNKGKSLFADSPQDNANGDYGMIIPRVRLEVMQIWKDGYFGNRLPGENLHFDHVVPRSLGGPGILKENIVPLPDAINLKKKDRVVWAFVTVARAWGLLKQEECDAWGDMYAEGQIFERQKMLTRSITADIRTRPRDEQRKFYFQILAEYAGEERVRRLFKAAGPGALPPNV